jgi:hypothetical protein
MFQWMEFLAQGPVAKAALALGIVAAAGLALGSWGARGIRLVRQGCYLPAFSWATGPAYRRADS